MTKTNTKTVLSTLSIAMMLVACNSNDHDAPATSTNNNVTLKTLTISPSLGKILKAKVVLKNATNNAPIGEQNTGSTGKVTFTIPSAVSTVIAEVQGGNGAQYFDEATGQMVDLPAGSMLRAATTVVANNSEIGVTALTEAAVKRAETLAGAGNIVPHLNAAKAEIQSAFGVADILKAPTLVGSQQELAALGSSPAEQYALRLATLAKVAQQQLGASETAPALKVAQAIANDLADGDIDGSGNTGALPYDVATFASQFQAEALKLIQDFITSASQNGFDAAKLQALLTFVQSNPLNLNVVPAPLLITSLLEPLNAVIGTNITITGVGFNSDKTKMQVLFVGDVAAEIISSTATELVVKVPTGITNGQVKITNTQTGKSATSVGSVNVGSVEIPIVVAGFTPTTAEVGAQVIITGTGFNADKANMLVKFANNITAEIVGATATRLVVKVPVGAVSGLISVTNTSRSTTVNSTSQFAISNANNNQITFGNVAYNLQTKPTGATAIPDQLVWDGSKFVGLEKSTDFHNESAKFSVWLSSNGTNWTRSATDLNSHFVAMVGMNNRVFQVLPGWQAGGATGSLKVSSSADGISWQSTTVTNSGFSTSTLLGGKYLNNKYFLSTNTDCMLMTSTDASAWDVVDLKTVVTTGVSVQPSGYCSLPFLRNGKLYVYRGVVGVGGTFNTPDHYAGAYYSSTDGVTWVFGMYDLPTGFNKIEGSGSSLDVMEMGNTLIIPEVIKREFVRDPVSGFLGEVILDAKVATSNDGVSWTFTDASGVVYREGQVGKPGPSTSLFQTPIGLLTANRFSSNCSQSGCQVNPNYAFTMDGRIYTPTQDYGLELSSFAKRAEAYSDTLKRLVVIKSTPTGIKIGTLDFTAP